MHHTVNLFVVRANVQEKNGAAFFYFFHVEAEMRDYLAFFHALAHQLRGPALFGGFLFWLRLHG